MNYIYNIKHIHYNYMFHNKELSVNDIVWAYEPKGKMIHKEFIAYNGIKYDDEHEGTGKVMAKYKVVEVIDYYEEYEKSQHSNAKVSYRTRKQIGVIEFDMNEENNRTYAYKLEKIEDVSMELSEFYVASKYEHYKNHILDYNKQCTLTRYNGLTKVILRSEKE